MSITEKGELFFLPLGGVGEIGMNLALYGYKFKEKREWLIVDMGVSFAGPDLPGVDLVLPDIGFLENERDNIRALLLTHGHEDHYGAVYDLWPHFNVPIYCSAFTAALLQTKYRNYSAVPDSFDRLPITIFQSGEKFQIGSFQIQPIAVSHSIPDAFAFAIKTPQGQVVHTGDWKLDPFPIVGPVTDEEQFRQLGNEGVLALVCDSTNAHIDQVALSERDIGQNIANIIKDAPGVVAVTAFSSHIGRIQSIIQAAHACDRDVLLLGSSLKRNVGIANELGYLAQDRPFLSEEAFVSHPRNKLVMIVTGSQGEPRSALEKIARGEMHDIALVRGDILIYSARAIPGNERAIHHIRNRLIDQGVRIITADEADIHVSGHPFIDQLKQMYEWVNPEILVPVHGDATHLAAHAALGRDYGLKTVMEIRNGDLLRLAPGVPEVIDRVACGRIYKDGMLIGDEEQLGIAERRKLSYVGQIALAILLDENNELLFPAKITAVGIPKENAEGKSLQEIVHGVIEATLTTLSYQQRNKEDVVDTAIRKAVRSAIYQFWGKKTIVTVFLYHL